MPGLQRPPLPGKTASRKPCAAPALTQLTLRRNASNPNASPNKVIPDGSGTAVIAVADQGAPDDGPSSMEREKQVILIINKVGHKKPVPEKNAAKAVVRGIAISGSSCLYRA